MSDHDARRSRIRAALFDYLDRKRNPRPHGKPSRPRSGRDLRLEDQIDAVVRGDTIPIERIVREVVAEILNGGGHHE